MAFTVYPVQETAQSCTDYEVKINGTPVALNTARVSKIPFNRRWPGYQRQQEQTELVNFLSASSDEVLTFEITPKEPFENAVIRPLSLGISPTCQDGRITFTLQAPAYFTVEPFGRSRALHIFIDPPVCYEKDPNVIYYGPGEHHVGLIRMQSNQTLFIDAGAVVYASVEAIDAENIKILGRGILDNSENKAQLLFDHRAEGNTTAVNNAIRRHTIQLEYCTHVQIEGITIRDSLVYNIRPIGCEDLHISFVKIIGCWRYNSDGIDMHNCKDVLIDNCFLRTFDDSICVKGFDCYYDGDVEQAVRNAMYRKGKAYDVFQNALIKNCVVWNDWGRCLEIGAETRAENISNITFVNCDVIHVTGPVLDCCNVDYADIHHIAYRDIRVEFDEQIPKPQLQSSDEEVYENSDPDYAPYLIGVTVSYHPEYSAGGDRRGKCHHILFENIRLFGNQKPRLRFKGYDEAHKCRDITVKTLYWNDLPVTATQQIRWLPGDFTENLRLLP